MACFSAILKGFFLVVAFLAFLTNSQNVSNQKLLADPEYERSSVLTVAQDRQSAFSKIPTSCSDLASIGRMENGLHLLKGAIGIRVAFCDFTKIPGTTGYETEIGYHSDLKSFPVFFQANKFKKFTQLYSKDPILVSYDEVPVNMGKGFNQTSGIFTVPATGKYLFLFYAMVNSFDELPSLSACLKTKEKSLKCVMNAPVTQKNAVRTFFIDFQSIQYLKTGDQVYVSLWSHGNFPDWESWQGITFSAFLMEEDLTSKLAEMLILTMLCLVGGLRNR